MKIRNGFVSNSSSSSFVIYNWFDIPEEKRTYIMNYDENALEVWKNKNISYQTNGQGFDPLEPFNGKEYHLSNSDEDSEFDFGYINNICRWTFYEDKKKNVCKVETYMDNFFMEEWLKYNQVEYDELYHS